MPQVRLLKEPLVILSKIGGGADFTFPVLPATEPSEYGPEAKYWVSDDYDLVGCNFGTLVFYYSVEDGSFFVVGECFIG